MSFLVIENLEESDQLILGRDLVQNFDATIDLNDGFIRIKNPESKYEKKPVYKILLNQGNVPILLDRNVRLKLNKDEEFKRTTDKYNWLKSMSSIILGRSFRTDYV